MAVRRHAYASLSLPGTQQRSHHPDSRRPSHRLDRRRRRHRTLVKQAKEEDIGNNDDNDIDSNDDFFNGFIHVDFGRGWPSVSVPVAPPRCNGGLPRVYAGRREAVDPAY